MEAEGRHKFMSELTPNQNTAMVEFNSKQCWLA